MDSLRTTIRGLSFQGEWVLIYPAKNQKNIPFGTMRARDELFAEGDRSER
jgi:hypothetical protein